MHSCLLLLLLAVSCVTDDVITRRRDVIICFLSIDARAQRSHALRYEEMRLHG